MNRPGVAPPPTTRAVDPESPFTVPNLLSLSRLPLSVVLFALITWEAWGWCLAVVILAAITDGLDGYLARRLNQESSLGRALDPLVDKVLVCGAFVFLLPFGAADGWLAPWMVTLVIVRELIITSLRGQLERRGVTFGADKLGKVKMVLQCAVLVLVFLDYWETPPASAAHPRGGGLSFGRDTRVTQFIADARLPLVYVMLVVTALSGLQYLWRAWRLRDRATPPG